MSREIRTRVIDPTSSGGVDKHTRLPPSDGDDLCKFTARYAIWLARKQSRPAHPLETEPEI